MGEGHRRYGRCNEQSAACEAASEGRTEEAVHMAAMINGIFTFVKDTFVSKKELTI